MTPVYLKWTTAILVLATSAGSAQAVVLLQQNFDGLTVGPVETFASETFSRKAWTATPPAGWVVTDDAPGDPLNDGVREFRGWTFVDKSWWTNTAGDQNRSAFTRGYGNVAVADPDEFDDFSLGSGEGRGPAPDGCDPVAGGCYGAGLTTPTFSLTGVAPGAARVIFDSSWRPEDTQKGTVEVSYNGGPFNPLLTYESVNADGTPGTQDGTGTFTKVTDAAGIQVGELRADNSQVNELIDLPINNPVGAASAQLRIRMYDAGNDWWWAVDNLQVYTGAVGPRDPALKVVVDRVTGNVSITNGTSQAVSLRGYSVVSEDGAFSEAAAQFQADSDSNWVQLTRPGDGSDLSEGHLSSFSIPSLGSINLGNGAWAPYFREASDLSFQYLVSGKTDPVLGLVEFVGAADPYPFLDLNFDRVVNINDWTAFLTITDTANLSNLTTAQAYRKGDLDADGRLGVNDFIVFQREYDRVNGAGSFAAALEGASVPEPAAWASMALAACLLGAAGRGAKRV